MRLQLDFNQFQMSLQVEGLCRLSCVNDSNNGSASSKSSSPSSAVFCVSRALARLDAVGAEPDSKIRVSMLLY